MKKLLAGLALGTLLIGAAIAQPYVYPQVTSVSPTDLIQDLPLGQPVGPSNQYATAALINNVPGYQKSTPLTAFTLTFKNGQSLWYITPAGTLATGTFTMAPAPGDGAVACAESTQTQTAVTIAANTGQAIGGTAVTAMTAATRYCWFYQASSSTWFPF